MRSHAERGNEKLWDRRDRLSYSLAGEDAGAKRISHASV